MRRTAVYVLSTTLCVTVLFSASHVLLSDGVLFSSFAIFVIFAVSVESLQKISSAPHRFARFSRPAAAAASRTHYYVTASLLLFPYCVPLKR